MEIEREEVRKKRSRSLSVCFPRIWLVAMCRCKSGTLRNQRVGQHQGALVEFSSFFFLGVIPQVRRCLMPRRGWSVMEVPNGWVQVLRGPRPNSVRRPMASRNAFDSCVARSVQQHFGNLTEEFPRSDLAQFIVRQLAQCHCKPFPEFSTWHDFSMGTRIHNSS